MASAAQFGLRDPIRDVSREHLNELETRILDEFGRESDMVAFINRKHKFFAGILNQPLVKGIAYNSKVPVLVMHDVMD